MGSARRHAWHLLFSAVRPLGSRIQRAEPGRADRLSRPPVLFLLHRDLATGSLLLDRIVDHRRHGIVLDERRGRTVMVRLPVSADRLDRPLHHGRALD